METALDKIKRATESAPVNIESLIRSFGIELDKFADLDPEISGEIAYIGDGKYRISANKTHHYYRQRFTIAHELGHYILHRELIGSGIDDNRAYRSVKNGNFYNKNITDAHEAQANRFAANILMPDHLVRAEFKNCNGDISAMSRKFKVSREAIGYALQNLGLTPPLELSDIPLPTEE